METTAQPSLSKIVMWVLIAHFVVLAWLGVTRSEIVFPQKKEKLLVQTVNLTPKKSQPAPQKKATVEKAAPKKAEPAKKTESAKKAEPTKKAEPVKKKTPSVQNQELLKKAQESIAKIHKSSDKRGVKAEPIAAPKKIGTLSVEQPQEVVASQELNYCDELTSRLKLLLKLPDYGAIKVKLTLTRSGKVETLEILSGESVENRKYVEKVLPTLKFPGFGENFGYASNHTFTITLENEF